MSNHPAPSSRSGFTLVEILVVVVILGIIAAIAVPNMVRGSDMQIVAGARMIASDLEYAQNLAITSQTPVTVTFDPVHDAYSLSDAGGTLTHPITKDPYTWSRATGRGMNQLDIVSAAFGGSSAVTFDEYGTPDNAGQVVLQAGPHVYRIEIGGGTGKISVRIGAS